MKCYKSVQKKFSLHMHFKILTTLEKAKIWQVRSKMNWFLKADISYFTFHAVNE